VSLSYCCDCHSCLFQILIGMASVYINRKMAVLNAVCKLIVAIQCRCTFLKIIIRPMPFHITNIIVHAILNILIKMIKHMVSIIIQKAKNK